MIKVYNIQMAITNLEELEKYICLTSDEREWDKNGKNTLPILISDNILPLLNEEAIRRQFVPSKAENDDTVGTLDPQEEHRYSITPRLVRRYKNRAAFLVTDSCFAYCRHCFRRRFSGSMVGPCSDEDIKNALSFLKEHMEIKELLLTGGDLFTLSNERLDYLLSSLKGAREDLILRLCTRALFSNPKRFTPELFKIIEKNNYGAPFYLLTQFNHASELTQDTKVAIRGFVKLGIPMMNQCVLLKGVNDTLEAQVELCNILLYNRIKPYYLFQGDLVQGTRHLRVALSDGLKLEEEMRENLSGLGMPQYTLDLPEGGGKIPLSKCYLKERNNDIWTIETPDGDIRHYPN